MIRDEILRLCERIDMPAEMTAKIAGELDSFDFSEAWRLIPGLLSPETGRYTTSLLGGMLDGYGLRLLTVSLRAALDTEREIYRNRGISERIFIDTMKCFPRMVREYHTIHGCYGFDCAFWTWRQLSGSLYRLGTLEFEQARYEGEGSPGLISPGTPILSVHIPSGADMSREALDDSYGQAREFFKGTQYEGAPFYCHSWLLSPKLRELLPESSGILRFMSDYELLSVNPDGDSANIRVFKTIYNSPSELPEETSLMRKLKALLIKGGHAGEAAGIITRF